MAMLIYTERTENWTAEVWSSHAPPVNTPPINTPLMHYNMYTSNGNSVHYNSDGAYIYKKTFTSSDTFSHNTSYGF